MKGIRSSFLRLLGALLQNLVNIINILLIFMTAIPDRLQRCLKNAVQELLDLHVAKSAAAVVILELIQICIVRKKLFKMLRLNKSIQIRKDRIAFDLSGILNPEMIVLGGVFMRQSARFMAEIEAALAREALPDARRVCRIVPAGLSEHIGDYAALAVANLN